MLENWKAWARALKLDVAALYFAARDPRVPWYAKATALAVAAYAFSPIDLIPDFIPVLGYLDDLVLLPIGIALAIRMVPPDVWSECKELASRGEHRVRQGWLVAAGIIAIWLVGGAFLIRWLLDRTGWL